MVVSAVRSPLSFPSFPRPLRRALSAACGRRVQRAPSPHLSFGRRRKPPRPLTRPFPLVSHSLSLSLPLYHPLFCAALPLPLLLRLPATMSSSDAAGDTSQILKGLEDLSSELGQLAPEESHRAAMTEGTHNAPRSLAISLSPSPPLSLSRFLSLHGLPSRLRCARPPALANALGRV